MSVKDDEGETSSKRQVDVSVEDYSKAESIRMQGVQGRVELNASSSGGVDKLNAAVEISGDRALSSLVCHRCKGVGHYAKDCGRPWVGDRLGRYQQEHGESVVSNLTELIAPLCVTQAAG
jgi:hypothetical protein